MISISGDFGGAMRSMMRGKSILDEAMLAQN